MIASQEIGSLITALGTGIGRNFNIDKLRYHKVVIMTDADVDGYHIRTLILTFFFRHMKEIIDRGYLYIAQPPLYKIKIGNKEKYIKNDEFLKQFLLEHFLVDNQVLINEKPVNIEMIKEISSICDSLLSHTKSFAGGYPDVAEVIFQYIINNDIRQFDERILSELEQLVTKKFNHRHEIKVDELGENLLCSYTLHNVINRFKIKIDTILNDDDVRNMYKSAFKYFVDGHIKIRLKNNKEVLCQNISDFAKKFTELYRHGLTIQRFKGLGEMNPEQLWETTMDANVRQLLQVKIEDIEITENIFAVLMGDNVELRREFIENSSYLMDEIDT